MTLGPLDPETIINLLLDEKPESFSSEKLIALMTLCAWMRWPDDEEIHRDAQTTAAATILLHQKEKGDDPAIPLTIDTLARCIVQRQIYGHYWEAFEEQIGITDLVAFFMFCPEELKPSMGKAYHFIDAGGFLNGDEAKDEKNRMKRARSSLKIAWKEQARSGALLLACEIFEEDPELCFYAPDDSDYFDAAEAFLKNKNRLLSFFGVALFFQEKLKRVLGHTAASNIRFLRFPDVVKPVDPGLGSFDAGQLAILAKYAAPQ